MKVFVTVARNGGTLDDVGAHLSARGALDELVAWRGDMVPSDPDAEVECLDCGQQLRLDDGAWASMTSGVLCSGENMPHAPDPRQAEWTDVAGGEYWTFDLFERELA